MTASCLSTSLPRPLLASALRQRRPLKTAVHPHQLLLSAVVAAVLGAALLVPEQPAAQAEICQRYNGAAACRVW